MLKAIFLSISILAASFQTGPSDEMFAKLQDAPSESEAGDAAMDIWASWMESGSATVDIMMERGVTAQANGKLAEARTYYDRAILIEPEYAEAWNRRATLFLTEENWSEALRDLNETLRLEPRHFGAWSGLGMIFESIGAEKQALEAYREALAIYPLMPAARRAEARLSKAIEGQGL
jgi:tetratricopeptide (TPR) repeat protein